MSNQEAFDKINHYLKWDLANSDDEKLKRSLTFALDLLEKHRCGYCDCIMDKKSKSKYGDYGRVCDNCYENLS